MTNQNYNKKGQAGNVLFLILIAVALFAALSYAVTQSTRSGGGDASNEKSLVSSASLTQYPASIKTAITRMLISNGVAVNFLSFDKPATFSALDDSAANKMKKNAVFHPDPGGGATYSDAPADVVTTTTGGIWTFNGNNSVQNIGTTDTSVTAATADIIAFLPKMQKSVCDKIHAQLGMAAVPPTTSAFAVVLANMQSSTTNVSTGGILASGVKITHASLDGQPQGCFYKDATDGYVYYHVLVER